ncbi:MAG: DUF4167 domain-containing protein [Robiginitomaculum sp.]|nr:DUF4167 domain-containing protein [Robiginitomaculum sp.]
MKRGRPRNNQGRHQNQNRKPSPNKALESNGPGIKVRGAASTIFEKYTQLAHDATTAGDRVGAEYYYQYAEHYGRLVQAQVQEREKREEEQRIQRDVRQAEYDARKAARAGEQQQQPQETKPTEPAVETTSEEPVKKPVTRRTNKSKAKEQSTASEIGLPESVLAEIPASTKPEPEEVAPVVRRRVRRPRAKVEATTETTE